MPKVAVYIKNVKKLSRTIMKTFENKTSALKHNCCNYKNFY